MTYVKVKLWLDGLGRGHHCMGDDETTKDAYDGAPGEREGTAGGDVCTSAIRRKNDLLRTVQVDVEGFDIQQSGYLGRFCLFVVHVAGKPRREKFGDKPSYRNVKVINTCDCLSFGHARLSWGIIITIKESFV